MTYLLQLPGFEPGTFEKQALTYDTFQKIRLDPGLSASKSRLDPGFSVQVTERTRKCLFSKQDCPAEAQNTEFHPMLTAKLIGGLTGHSSRCTQFAA